MQKLRSLDKLVDALARGKQLEDMHDSSSALGVQQREKSMAHGCLQPKRTRSQKNTPIRPATAKATQPIFIIRRSCSSPWVFTTSFFTAPWRLRRRLSDVQRLDLSRGLLSPDRHVRDQHHCCSLRPKRSGLLRMSSSEHVPRLHVRSVQRLHRQHDGALRGGKHGDPMWQRQQLLYRLRRSGRRELSGRLLRPLS